MQLLLQRLSLALHAPLLYRFTHELIQKLVASFFQFLRLFEHAFRLLHPEVLKQLQTVL